MTLFPRRGLLAALIAVSLSGCSSDDAAQDPLSFVPADSPYVLANRVATPEAITQAWLEIYGTSLKDVYADMATDPDLAAIEGEFGEWVRAAVPEMGAMGSLDGMKSLGLKPEARYAFYGQGLMPVYRIELGDPAKFSEVVARIEGRAGKKLATRKFDDFTLWQFANDKATVLFGPINNQLVITVAPAQADEARLRTQLGLTKPESSLLDAKGLETLDSKHGYTGHLSGYIDVVALAQRLSGRNEADNQVIAAFGGDVPKISPECATELDSITAKMPRVVFGTTTFEAKRMVVNSVIEMESGLAKSLSALAAPIPGSDVQDSTLFRMAVSANLPEAVRFLGGVADSIAASPFKCEELASVNASAAEKKQGLANPALAMAGSISAVHFGLTALELGGENEMPKSLAGFITVGSATPVMLWGLMQSSAPPLANISLSTDGKVVPLPKDAAPMPFPLQLKAVMTDKSLGIATADIEDNRFVSLATVPATSDGTMLRYGLNGSFFKILADQIPAAPDGTSEQDAKEMERGRQMLKQMGERMGDMDVRMRLTAVGVEFVQDMRLK